ncbi:variant erythrocyte surface antigen-1 alpha subunit [Babesia bovis T2Bo]|uniref:Variant erythrocyte surface antigen-1, alpha subunit n=1 Tax=Babesia bovis TaxID=5865 RepID=A7AQW0_BABBO|nr:variant erythrocyte surface antigen-1 alpha subunit [Babesia bovis T2Bo]EDO06929.1 variant erythrocyte surface antigen-1 alpha subunit [Babesia bovis T2Bo]|eukprot:XP_001610497.1 variant erythrocyte surface antigen-1, alpha subunit [Babesia bovis T2Bo]
MAPASTFTPKASLTDAPTNLKEAIDWVLRVTGKDGKDNGECICGLAAAVTDLLQSVELEYNGYQGDVKDGTDTSKGATEQQVKGHLNGLFSLVQGLGGTAVVRTYIDQLAQVLSALVGWSKIDKCWEGKNGKCTKGGKVHHGQNGSCKYLLDVKPNMPCTECKCMKWKQPDPINEGVQLGRRCTRCKDSGSSSDCKCSTGGCAAGQECKCAKEGKCCKCCCKDKCGTCSDKCSCVKEKDIYGLGLYGHNDSYTSAYPNNTHNPPTWKDLKESATKRHHCARIFLGSVCLIWSGITYMYWTGKWHGTSPRWNNHILDGRGLDDGSLSQWLQALGFPREMLNDAGPGNRLDAIIWDGLRDKLYLGFLEPSGLNTSDVKDENGNTARSPFGMNYAGFIHTAHRDSFNSDATVFPNGTSSSSAGQISDTNTNKCGALYKLYILSCAYFTGLQQKAPPKADNKTPRTIREILYWLSALPYSQAYKDMLDYAKKRLKEVLKKPGDNDSTNGETQLKFYQTGLKHPITVDEYNLFAHFQAVTQYCPLVLIGIQGGIHSPKGTTTGIHSLYANTECGFTYPTVSIQAYNQVVHYIRALFYQLYFLRKQCAMKVALGGKWRECRYGNGVLGKDVVSWMCLGCDPMEHDRKCRVKEMGKGLDGVKNVDAGAVSRVIKDLLVPLGNVVVQLGNAQEALEGKKKEAIEGVKTVLGKAKGELDKAKQELEQVNGKDGQTSQAISKAKKALEALTNGGSGALHTLVSDGLEKAANGEEWKKDYSSAKDKISAAIKAVRDALEGLLLLKDAGASGLKENKETLLGAIKDMLDMVSSTRCVHCKDHKDKCGKTPKPTICKTCHQQYNEGFPSPLQAFLEDRLPGFSCRSTMDELDKQEVEKAQNKGKDTSHASALEYPSAASHLGHCNGSGQCCPLPMGFRNNFQDGVTNTGQRLYGMLYFFSNENMMQSCVYTLVRVTAALSATTPQVLGDVFGFFRGGVGNPVKKEGDLSKNCDHQNDPKTSTGNDKYFCGWCASGLRDEVKKIEWIPKGSDAGGQYMDKVGKALRDIKGSDSTATTTAYSSTATANTSLSRLTKNCQYLSPLTGELYTAVSATFGNTYLSWVLYLSDSLYWGLQSLSDAFQQIECRGCTGCDPNKCKKGEHGSNGGGQCGCQSIVSCTGVLPVLYRHGFSYGNPFNLEGYEQKDEKSGDYSIENTKNPRQCHEFLSSLGAVIKKKEATQKDQEQHPLTNLLSEVGKLQYDIRLPWIFVLTLAWLVAVLYLAFGAIWPLDWTHMRSHWLRGGEHQWQCMWYKVMTGRKGMELVEYFGKT